MIIEQTGRRLAEFTAGLRYEDIPGETLEKAKQFVLDVARLAVIGSRLPWGERIREVFRQIGGKEESTVLGFGDRLPAINAAYVNGTTSHGLENDDTHVAAIHHPGVTVIPAVLAVAEREGLGGKELLRGMIAGYEVMIRLGVAMQPSLYGDRGFHCTAVMGHFGAAAGVANLLELSTEEAAHALGIAASYASGLANFLSGGMIKYIHAGKAAKAGVEAVLLAAGGMTGPKQIFEGKHGFCHGYADRYDLETITDGLGKEWKTVEVHLKPHCTSRHTQAAVEAAATIASEHDLRPEDLASVEVRTSREMAETLICTAPTDIIEGQTSIPFAVATALFKGGSRTLDEFVLFEDIKQAMENPRVLSLAQSIQMQPDSSFDAQKGNAAVTIRVSDGRIYIKQVDIIRGSPDNPFTMQELRDRFLDQAQSVLPREQLIQAADLIERLENVGNIQEITSLLH